MEARVKNSRQQGVKRGILALFATYHKLTKFILKLKNIKSDSLLIMA